MANEVTMQLKLTLGKSTKGKHVYEDKESDAPVPSMYVRRDSLSKAPRKFLLVTVVESDE